MRLFDQIGSKLRDTNQSLADASKTWRDDRLTKREAEANERETDLAEREDIVADQLDEIRRLEGRRVRRRFLYLFFVLVGAVPAFFTGFVMGTDTSPRQIPPSTTETPKVADVKVTAQPVATRPAANTERKRYSDPDAAARAGKYGTGNDFNVGHYCLDLEASGGLSFDECVGVAVLALTGDR